MTEKCTPKACFIPHAPILGTQLPALKNFALLRDDAGGLIGFAVSEDEISTSIWALCFEAPKKTLWLTTGEGATKSHYPVDTGELPEDVLAALNHCCENGLELSVFRLPVEEDDEKTSLKDIQG
jgi:hypothetical protein